MSLFKKKFSCAEITEAVKNADKKCLEKKRDDEESKIKKWDSGEVTFINPKDGEEYSLPELAQMVGIALFEDLKEYRKSNDVEHILGTEIMALNALTNVARLSKDLNS